jgi:cytochrome oxidase Cu insertion factor (SCO1/SenC/PrrC family)
MNPEKCSLTITKLGRLQRRLGHEGFHGKVNVAGITYDPGFDLPARLRTYGADRGMIFDRCNRLLRTTGPFEPLRQWFALGVGYGPVTVNRHRLDLVVLNEAGHAAATYRRRLWHEDDVFKALAKIAGLQERPPAQACRTPLARH